MTPPCPFTAGQPVRNTATGQAATIHDTAGIEPGWVAVRLDNPAYGCLAVVWPLMLIEAA